MSDLRGDNKLVITINNCNNTIIEKRLDCDIFIKDLIYEIRDCLIGIGYSNILVDELLHIKK